MNTAADISMRVATDLFSRHLSRDERLILILRYYQRLSMKEIAVTLDLSESRVNQMHVAIVARFKTLLHNQRRELRSIAR